MLQVHSKPHTPAAAAAAAAVGHRYAWEALVINELQGLDLFLSAPGVSLSLPVKGQVFLQVGGVGVGVGVLFVGFKKGKNVCRGAGGRGTLI